MKIASLFLALVLPASALAADRPPSEDPRVKLGLVSEQVVRGERLFSEETFGGNGRTCTSCHVYEDNTQIELSTIRSLPPDAPFFARNVPGLEQPSFINQGLIEENVDGLANPPMFRSTPHVLSLTTSIHSNKDQAAGTDAVGWSSDGAPPPGTLRDFATGAVRQHFTKSLARVEGVDFRLPTDQELDDLLAFQLALGRTADISLAGVHFNDPAAERARSGPGTFLDAVGNNCQRCHGDLSANRGVDGGGPELTTVNGVQVPTGNQAKDTNVDAMRSQFAPHDDGRGFPGDEQFSPPPLIEAADTGPFFHIGAQFDIESAVRFYTVRGVGGQGPGLFSGQQQVFDEQMTQDIGALLRAANAAFNAQLATQRLEAALQVALFAPDDPSISKMIDMAAEEADDGAGVLRSPGAEDAKNSLAYCASLAHRAADKLKPIHHLDMIEGARDACAAATPQLGSGLTMQLGSGNVLLESSRFHSRGEDDEGPPGKGPDGNGPPGQSEDKPGNGPKK